MNPAPCAQDLFDLVVKLAQSLTAATTLWLLFYPELDPTIASYFLLFTNGLAVCVIIAMQASEECRC